MKENYPDFSLESEWDAPVAGIDEAGRGPLAGPVVAAAVVFKSTPDISGINDSKKLTPTQRDKLFDIIQAHSLYGIGIATAEEIDRLNILKATFLAMRRAFDALPERPKAALVDGNRTPYLPCQTRCIIKGDSKSLSIAAASILAKVTRDRMMQELHKMHPHYGWDSNAGYGTKLHLDGIKSNGITVHHRRSFSPIKEMINQPQIEIPLREFA